MSNHTTVPWRTGHHFGIHVYTVDNVPVATFHTAMDAAAAVRAHNTVLTGVLAEAEARFDSVVQGLHAEVERLRAEHIVEFQRILDADADIERLRREVKRLTEPGTLGADLVAYRAAMARSDRTIIRVRAALDGPPT
jgi:hypothetical protein